MSRKKLIFTTARKIIVENGLFDSSMGKIAKEANIPVGSIYTYYKSKEELINDIFVETKKEMGQYIFQPIVANKNEKEELKIYWIRSVDFGLEHQEKFFFAEQFANSPLIKITNKEEVHQTFERIFFLLEKGVKGGILKSLSVPVLHNIIYANVLGTIKFFALAGTNITEKLKDQLFECCWDSIKI